MKHLKDKNQINGVSLGVLNVEKKQGNTGQSDQNTALIFCQAIQAGFKFQAPSHNRCVFLDVLKAWLQGWQCHALG